MEEKYRLESLSSLERLRNLENLRRIDLEYNALLRYSPA